MVQWVEKASFNCLNRLFEITSVERHYQTLLTARNLLAVVREPQSYVLNILPRRLPKVVVPKEHFVLKDLPFYERAREADAKALQERLDQQEEKRQEGTLRKAPSEKGPGKKDATLFQWFALRLQRRKRKPLRRLSRLCPRLLIFRLHLQTPRPVDRIALPRCLRTLPAPRSLRLSVRGLALPNLSRTLLA